VTALLDVGLSITGLVEHVECDWLALPWMEQIAPDRYALPAGRDRVPLMYTLTAVTPRQVSESTTSVSG
jgi:hypothetical protein